jgi:hypothetical protein
MTDSAMGTPVYALGRVSAGSYFIMTKFDEGYRRTTEYIPAFRTLAEAEMELRLVGQPEVSVLSFDSIAELQRRNPSRPVRYEFDLLLEKGRSGHV